MTLDPWCRLAPMLMVPGLGLLAACAGPGPTPASQFEEFDSASTHTRSFAASDQRTCEAARRALLSQGYVIGGAAADSVQAKKSYQPESEVHVEVEIRVVCAREGPKGKSTAAFVSALQDRYALRKSASSASLGVGALGSVSLPFAGSNDSMVKVASETVTSRTFYNRFFALVERYLAGQPDPEPEPAPAAPPMPVPSTPPAPPAPAAAPAAAPASAPPAAPAAPPASPPTPAPTPPASPTAPSPVPAPAPAASEPAGEPQSLLA
jgi:Uncharacterized protein conserved in bacteria (DUF2242)